MWHPYIPKFVNVLLSEGGEGEEERGQGAAQEGGLQVGFFNIFFQHFNIHQFSGVLQYSWFNKIPASTIPAGGEKLDFLGKVLEH